MKTQNCEDKMCFKIWRPEDESDIGYEKIWDVRIWDAKMRRCDADATIQDTKIWDATMCGYENVRYEKPDLRCEGAKMRCGCEDATRMRRSKMQIWDVKMFGPMWQSKTQDVASPVLLHANTSTQKQFYAQSLLHTNASIYTPAHNGSHTNAFTHMRTHTLPLHSKVLTHKQTQL